MTDPFVRMIALKNWGINNLCLDLKRVWRSDWTRVRETVWYLLLWRLCDFPRVMIVMHKKMTMLLCKTNLHSKNTIQLWREEPVSATVRLTPMRCVQEPSAEHFSIMERSPAQPLINMSPTHLSVNHEYASAAGQCYIRWLRGKENAVGSGGVQWLYKWAPILVASITLWKCHCFNDLAVHLTCEWVRCQQFHTNMTELVREASLLWRSTPSVFHPSPLATQRWLRWHLAKNQASAEAPAGAANGPGAAQLSIRTFYFLCNT